MFCARVVGVTHAIHESCHLFKDLRCKSYCKHMFDKVWDALQLKVSNCDVLTAVQPAAV
jgi:hypothetical protein